MQQIIGKVKEYYLKNGNFGGYIINTKEKIEFDDKTRYEINMDIAKNKNIKHGYANHRLYATWSSMISRCYNVKRDAYKYYGGRGIKVCERWKDIANFIEDMMPTFQEGLTLDRINNDKDYEASNCRWSDNYTQNCNTRKLNAVNSTGFRGVTLTKNHKYVSAIRTNGKHVYLGLYTKAILAAQAYDDYVTQHNLPHTKNFS